MSSIDAHRYTTTLRLLLPIYLYRGLETISRENIILPVRDNLHYPMARKHSSAQNENVLYIRGVTNTFVVDIG